MPARSSRNRTTCSVERFPWLRTELRRLESAGATFANCRSFLLCLIRFTLLLEQVGLRLGERAQRQRSLFVAVRTRRRLHSRRFLTFACAWVVWMTTGEGPKLCLNGSGDFGRGNRTLQRHRQSITDNGPVEKLLSNCSS